VALSSFQKAVLDEVRKVPPGSVASYGQIAAYIGQPRAARQVGGAMNSMEGVPDFPWWRIINNAGVITIKGAVTASKRLQKELLEAEGVEVSAEFTVDMARYRHHSDDPHVEWQGADNVRLL
jgi:methylated-DNA-protein-cysteine methyltransferase related protein